MGICGYDGIIFFGEIISYYWIVNHDGFEPTTVLPNNKPSMG
jgi:hypothetical protein